MFLCAAQSQGRFKPRCASSAVPFPPPKAQHPHHHSGETPFQCQELARGCFLGSLSGWWTWDGAAHMQQVWVLLALMLIASQRRQAWRGWDQLWYHAQTRGLAAQEQRRHFCKSSSACGATVRWTRRVLCYFTENFVAAFKAQRPGHAASHLTVKPRHSSRCNTGRRARAAFSLFPPAGKKWFSSIPAGHCQNGVLCWRKSPPCLDFLIRSGPAQSPVSPSAWAGKMSLMAGASHRGQNRMLGASGDPEGAALRAPHCVWNSFMWKAAPQCCWHLSVRSCVPSESACPVPSWSALLLWRSEGTRWAHPPAHRVLAKPSSSSFTTLCSKRWCGVVERLTFAEAVVEQNAC